MWKEVLERLEGHAPVSVMARVALELSVGVHVAKQTLLPAAEAVVGSGFVDGVGNGVGPTKDTAFTSGRTNVVDAGGYLVGEVTHMPCIP